MEIENSPLWSEVSAITGNMNKTTHYLYTATLHANGQDYPVYSVVEISNRRDYESAHADMLMITVKLLAGTYYTKIYPYMDSLEMTVYRTPLGETSDAVTGGTVETERYIATLANPTSGGNPLLQQNGRMQPTEVSLNLSDFPSYQFQLVNKAIAQMRMTQVGQIFRKATTDSAIRALLTKVSSTINVDTSRAIQGVNIIKGHNQNTREHIVIPQGISALDIPQYIHERCGGVYTSGFGYYLQGNYWYVYPCYDPTQTTNGGKVLTIINVPENKMPGIERSYRVSGNNIVILGNGQTKFSDQSNADQLNHGNGVRFTDAQNFMDKIVTAVDNKAKLMRPTLNSEVTNFKRPNGLQNALRSVTPITANPYQEYSKLSKRNGSVIGMAWQYSDPSLITPGLPVKILYLNGNTVSVITGIILKAEHHTRSLDQGVKPSRHVTDTGLSIFTARPIGNGYVSNTGTAS